MSVTQSYNPALKRHPSDMSLLAIDIGTTHCKAGLFSLNGDSLAISSKPMNPYKNQQGGYYFNSNEVLQTVRDVIRDVTGDKQSSIAAIGIASMAETGILVDCTTGEPRSPLIPWFDSSSHPQADLIAKSADSLELYEKFGLMPNFKCSLSKILWLRQFEPQIAKNAIWLSAADYILYQMTGVKATDYSLACRTLAFRVDHKEWDRDWLKEWDLRPELFPPAYPGGTIVGKTTGKTFELPAGIPVAVCGHDHVCAALAVGAIEPGIVFDSMGTAEALIGTLKERPLTEKDFQIGLQYGCHVAKGRGYWMGGLSTSGGAIEWLRGLPGGVPISYDELDDLLRLASPEPTRILFFPYLLGSGSPHMNSEVRGAFIGLDLSHGTKDLLKSVLEGVGFEMEYIRRAGEKMTGQTISDLIVAGGGSRYRTWLQIKADIFGCRIRVSSQSEATLQGAALAAGIGCGIYRDEQDALSSTLQPPVEEFFPDPSRHRIYNDLFENGFLLFQDVLRRYTPFSDKKIGNNGY